MWEDEVCELIAGQLGVKENWNSYGAHKPKLESINMAIDFVRMLGCMNVFPRPSVSVTPGGHTFLCWNWHGQSKELSIEFCPDKGALINFWDCDEDVDYDCILRMED